MNWIKVNSKPCPKCGNAINKNGGCMHMTCKCGYEFCWLCLGDYRKHQEETGKYLCATFEDVKAAGRDAGEMEKEEMDREMAERELKRFEHYSTRYIEHQRSVHFSALHLKSTETTIENLCRGNSEMDPADFSFLVDIAGLVLAARRSLSMTYAIRFFLKGKQKQAFFDWLQANLERSLERLNIENEKDWISLYMEYDQYGRNKLGPKFQ